MPFKSTRDELPQLRPGLSQQTQDPLFQELFRLATSFVQDQTVTDLERQVEHVNNSIKAEQAQIRDDLSRHKQRTEGLNHELHGKYVLLQSEAEAAKQAWTAESERQKKSHDELDGRLKEQQSNLTSSIHSLEARVENRFEGFESRFEGLGARFEGFESRLEGLGARFEGLEANVSTILKGGPGRMLSQVHDDDQLHSEVTDCSLPLQLVQQAHDRHGPVHQVSRNQTKSSCSQLRGRSRFANPIEIARALEIDRTTESDRVYYDAMPSLPVNPKTAEAMEGATSTSCNTIQYDAMPSLPVNAKTAEAMEGATSSSCDTIQYNATPWLPVKAKTAIPSDDIYNATPRPLVKARTALPVAVQPSQSAVEGSHCEDDEEEEHPDQPGAISAEATGDVMGTWTKPANTTKHMATMPKPPSPHAAFSKDPQLSPASKKYAAVKKPNPKPSMSQQAVQERDGDIETSTFQPPSTGSGSKRELQDTAQPANKKSRPTPERRPEYLALRESFREYRHKYRQEQPKYDGRFFWSFMRTIHDETNREWIFDLLLEGGHDFAVPNCRKNAVSRVSLKKGFTWEGFVEIITRQSGNVPYRVKYGGDNVD